MDYAMTCGVLYTITNVITGECYVGQTRQKTKVRWANHRVKLDNRTHHSKKLQTAWNSYGEDSFIFTEIFYAFNRHDLNACEIEVIKDVRPKYNMTAGGAGSRDRDITFLDRKKISERMKLKWRDPAFREKMATLNKERGKTEVRANHMRSIQLSGVTKRWEGHIKKEKVKVGMGGKTRESWENPVIREKRIAGLHEANKRPEVVEKRRAASIGRVMPKDAVYKSAKAKWKPVTCIELGISFLSMKFAAEFINVKRTTISEAIKFNRKVSGEYSFTRAA